MNTASKSGASPLMVAAQENHPEVVKLLIEAGANLDQKKTKTGQTALWTAAFSGHTEVCNGLQYLTGFELDTVILEHGICI